MRSRRAPRPAPVRCVPLLISELRSRTGSALRIGTPVPCQEVARHRRGLLAAYLRVWHSMPGAEGNTKISVPRFSLRDKGMGGLLAGVALA